jgi:hypothetical protein
VDISDGDVAMSAFCSLCSLYLLVIVQLWVIPLLICGFGFIVVPVVVLAVLFVVNTRTRTHTVVFGCWTDGVAYTWAAFFCPNLLKSNSKALTCAHGCFSQDCLSMQDWRDVAVTVAMHAQVCDMVRESLSLMALVATEAIQDLSDTERDSFATALTIGTDSVSRCLTVLNNVLGAAGHTQNSGTGLTGVTS